MSYCDEHKKGSYIKDFCICCVLRSEAMALGRIYELEKENIELMKNNDKLKERNLNFIDLLRPFGNING